jgi:5-methylcytosine-specific restriction endonuclease McrA
MAKNYQADLPCLVCLEEGEGKVCFHHVKTRKSGGPDEPWNMMPLCQEHHNEVHQKGLGIFALRYAQVVFWLKSNNWDYCAFNNKWIHS